ncbi:MAG: hemolysin family protein [Nanoarchaeota archaeon]|nr:hemolysin family protein [Nanoarchaeota archaeon]
MPTTQIIVLIVLIILSAFFSGAETALMSINKLKLNALVKQKKKGAETLFRIKQDTHRLIITILIGNNLVNIGAASLATIVFTNMFGSAGIGIATGVMTFFILIFGEITPKTFASQNAVRISLAVARPVEILSYILYPFVWFFGLIARLISKIVIPRGEEKISEEELRTLVTMGRAEGILEKETAEIMHNVLEFRDTKVVEVMTPENEMETVDGSKKLKDVIDFVAKSPYSRHPVYLEDRDKIIGILDVDDVLKYAKDQKLNVKVKSIIRKPYFVPESKEIDDLLTEFESRKIPMAIVVDEYGDVEGLVTMDDILEEIVGDIFDKSKRDTKYIKKTKGEWLKVDARATLEDLNRSLKLGLKSEHYNTIGGYVEHKLQRIPRKGEKVNLKNITIEVEKVTDQKIKSLKILKK